MSRIAIVFMSALLAMPASASEPPLAEQIIAKYTRLTSAEPKCRRNPSGDEIVICGRREADRYRVPLIIPEAGDPGIEGLYAERERLQHITTPCQEHSIFLVGCGMVGVTVGFDLAGSGIKYRALAP
jgi:hypothetical protein